MGFTNKVGHYAHKTARLSAQLEDFLLVLIVVLMILLATTQIVLRNFFETGISWSDPLLRIAVLWVGLLGAMVATREQNHIKIDLLSKALPPLGKRIITAISQLFSSAVCALIAYHAGRFVYMEYEDGITAFANVPAWACEIIMPVGFGLMALRFFFNFINALGKQSPASESTE